MIQDGELSEVKTFVAVRSDKWIFADPDGSLGEVGSSCEVFRGAAASGGTPEVGRADAADMAPLEQEVLQMRRIPWQTPHTFEKQGKLILSDTGQEWLDKAVKQRETLAEEVRAEAGESSFIVELPIRKMWVKEQELDAGLAEWFKAAEDETDHHFRRHPEDGCLEKPVSVG